jgi:hypothetical protein
MWDVESSYGHEEGGGGRYQKLQELDSLRHIGAARIDGSEGTGGHLMSALHKPLELLLRFVCQ